MTLHSAFSRLSLAAASALLLVAASASFAGTRQFQVVDWGQYEIVTINNGGAGMGSAYNGQAAVGRFNGKFLDNNEAVRMFCVDARHFDGSPFTTLDANSIPLVSDAATAFDTTERFYKGDDYGGVASALTQQDYIPTAGTVPSAAAAATRASKAAFLVDKYGNGTYSTHRLAAVQVAIWDILQDGGDGLAAGTFTATFDNTEYGYVMSDVANVTSSYKGNAIWIEAQRTTAGAGYHVQDWAYSPIPEPVFFQMGCLSTLGGLGLLRMRRRG